MIALSFCLSFSCDYTESRLLSHVAFSGIDLL